MSNLIKLFVNLTRFALFFFTDFFVLLFARRKKNIFAKIVLIRTDAIGDFVIWLDSAKALARKYGAENIILIVNSVNLQFAEKFPFWKTIIPISPKKLRNSFLYRYKILKTLRGINCRMVINTTYSRSYQFDDTLVRFVNAKNKIGVAGDTSNNSSAKNTISNCFYSRIIKVEPGIISEFKRNSEILNKLGIEYLSSIFLFPDSFFVPIQDFNLPEQYFVLFPGSSNYKKEWPKENFVSAANFIYKKFGLQCVICGGSDNARICDFIFNETETHSLNIAGKTTLIQLASIIKNAEFVLSNDTSAIHIAASSKTMSFCIAGGGHFGRFLPYDTHKPGDIPFYPTVFYSQMPCFNCNWNCIYKNAEKYPCVCAIKPETVCDAIEKKFSAT